MSYKEFKNIDKWRIDQFSEPEDINRILKQFIYICSECESHNVDIFGYSDMFAGTKYTGCDGSNRIILKCLDCGNAISIRYNGFTEVILDE